MTEKEKKLDKVINQIEKELSVLEKMDETIERLISHFSTIHAGRIKRRQIFEVLFLLFSEKYKLERPGDIWDAEIEYDEALKLLSNFNFDTVFDKIETPQEIIPANFLMEFKVWIKSKGLIWVIHKSDVDPFPGRITPYHVV